MGLAGINLLYGCWQKNNWNSKESFMYYGSQKDKAPSRNEKPCIQMVYTIYFSHIFKEGFSFPNFVR
jgi:hypothetical protein